MREPLLPSLPHEDPSGHISIILSSDIKENSAKVLSFIGSWTQNKTEKRVTNMQRSIKKKRTNTVGQYCLFLPTSADCSDKVICTREDQLYIWRTPSIRVEVLRLPNNHLSSSESSTKKGLRCYDAITSLLISNIDPTELLGTYCPWTLRWEVHWY